MDIPIIEINPLHASSAKGEAPARPQGHPPGLPESQIVVVQPDGVDVALASAVDVGGGAGGGARSGGGGGGRAGRHDSSSGRSSSGRPHSGGGGGGGHNSLHRESRRELLGPRYHSGSSPGLSPLPAWV